MTGQGLPPTGTIALLFTDIEGSTALATRLGATWAEILNRHHAVLSEAIERERGWIDGTEGDAFFATFSEPAAAARAAVAAQRALRQHSWREQLGDVRVRMGLHVGHVERTTTGYVGLEVHRAARVAAAAHGGQLLLTAAARELVGDTVPVEFLGAHRVKDFPAPVQLYCAVIDGRGASAFPPPRAADARPTNLPAGLPSLVGRDDEEAEIRVAILDEGERLVSLTGRGGSGKSSLALVAAAGLLDEHPGGVWWVNLAAVTLPEAVLDAVAAAVGAERELRSSAFDAVAGRLRGTGPVLIVLDNMEHLLAACQDVRRLLDALPELRIIVTSQVPLRLDMERVIALDALADAAALTLIERVTRRRGGRLPSRPSENEALMDVIHLLDGMPLALELAAARLALLSPGQLLDRLTSSIDVLKDPARPERQRSLQATVDWTLGLLDDRPRELFNRLGAFAGPVELEEIEQVCGQDGLDVVESLSALLDVALVRRVESGDGRIRFGLPEALRQIASRSLDAIPDAARWRRAHAERQLELIAVGMYPTAEDLDAAVATQPEAAAALQWAREHGEAIAEPLAAHRAFHLINHGGLREAASLLTALLDSPPEDVDIRCLVLETNAVLLTLRAEHDEGLRYAEEALSIAEGTRNEWMALEIRGLALEFSGRPELALSDHRQGTALARNLDAATLAGALLSEVQSLIAAGELDEADERLEEVRRLGRTVNATALRFVETQEADLAMARRRPEEALDPYARSLEKAEAGGDVLQVLFDLRGMANALGTLERDEQAIEVLGLADIQAMDVGGSSSELGQHLQGDEPVRLALERLGPARAQAARAKGHAVAAGLRVARACQLGRSVLSSTRDIA